MSTGTMPNRITDSTTSITTTTTTSESSSSPPPPPETRGLFGIHGDSKEWNQVVSQFPNHVPRFRTKEETIRFVRDYTTHHGGSNVQFPHLQHIFTLLVGWEQIASILLPQITKIRQEPSMAPPVVRSYGTTTTTKISNDDNNVPLTASSEVVSPKNIYERPECAPVVAAIAQRLDVSFHQCTTAASTHNTFQYLYHHMKFGIFVMIQNHQLRVFAPFVNVDYINTWSQQLNVEGDGTLDTYYTQKAGLYREEQIELDKSKWWANGNIIW
jgi:hypothetical protein